MARSSPDHLVSEVIDRDKDQAMNNRHRESSTAFGEGYKNTGREENKKHGNVEAHKEVHFYFR